MISLTFLLCANPNITNLLQREYPQMLAGIGAGVGKIVDFRHLNRHISETVQYGPRCYTDH